SPPRFRRRWARSRSGRWRSSWSAGCWPPSCASTWCRCSTASTPAAPRRKGAETGLTKNSDAVYLQFGMIRVSLTDTTRGELHALRRTDLPAKVRDRVEMVLSSGAGWSAPRIAAHLGYCGHTVRGILKDFNARGTPALYPNPTGPSPDTAKRAEVTGHLRQLLGEDRTWTAGQLAEALHPHGVRLGPRQVRRYLRLLRAGYRRTASTLGHKQDPAKVARAEQVLAGLAAKAAAGRLR